jgi:hypothetical protein
MASVRWIVFALLAFGGGKLTGADMALGSGEVAPGRSVSLALVLSDGQNQLGVFQCDLAYDSDVLNIAVDRGPSAKAAEKNVTYSQPATNMLRLVVAGVNRNTIPDGIVVLLSVTAKRSAAQGGNYFIQVSGAVGGTVDAIPLATKVSSGRVSIVAPERPVRGPLEVWR